MTLKFVEGFDVADWALKGWVRIGSGSGGGSGGFDGQGRFGTGGWTSGDSYGPHVTIKKGFTACSQLYMGMAYYPGARINIDESIIQLWGDGGTTCHLQLKLPSSGTSLVLCRGDGTVLGTTGPTDLSSGWNHIEMSATIASSGGVVEVRIGGVTKISFTGNTKNGGTNNSMDAIQLGTSYNNGTAIGHLDDVYVCDGTGPRNNGFLGDCRVRTLLPTAAGASTQFAPSVGSNWDNVNDVPVVPGTFNSSSVSGSRDTYTMADLPEGTVFGVQGVIQALKTDAGAASIKGAFKSGGSVYYENSQALLGTSGIYVLPVREIDPATAANWTSTNVNALEFGVEVA